MKINIIEHIFQANVYELHKNQHMSKVKNESLAIPMLFPYEPDEFWERLGEIIRDEIIKTGKGKPVTTNQTS